MHDRIPEGGEAGQHRAHGHQGFHLAGFLDPNGHLPSQLHGPVFRLGNLQGRPEQRLPVHDVLVLNEGFFFSKR